MDISLIASSVRPHLWDECFRSLKGNTCEYEVLFAGDTDLETSWEYQLEYPFFKYVTTGRIKPAQCYEVARRAAKGKYIMWIADDCEFSPGLLDNIIKKMDNLPYKTLLSVKTNENNQNNNLDDHCFFDGFVDPGHTSPLMAPLGIINAEYLQQLGGFDRRYLCGQYENDVAMRVYADGGDVVKYEEGVVSIEHIRKHGASTKFWSGYDHDRKILEDTWAIGGYMPVVHKTFKTGPLPASIQMIGEGDLEELKFMAKRFGIGETRVERQKFDRKVSRTPLLSFESYTDEDILTKSQSFKGDWS